MKTAEDYFEKALQYISEENPDKAFECFDEAIKANPHFFKAWNNKGCALEEKGLHDEAKKCFNVAAEIKARYD